MDKKPVSLPPGIKAAGLGKGVLSFLLDVIFTVALMVGLYYAIGVPVILNNSDYSSLQTTLKNTLRDSGITKEEDGVFKIYVYQDSTQTAPEDYAYKKYINMMWDYFTVVLPSNENLTPTVEFTSSDNVQIPVFKGKADLSDPAYGKWIYENFFGYSAEAEKNYFFPSVADDFSSRPTALEEEHVTLGQLMLRTNAEMNTYIGYYPRVLGHLQNQPYLLQIQAKMQFDTYAAKLPTFTIPALIFFFILPLCLREGRTLGKLIVGVAVIGIDGYRAPKFNIGARQFIITAMWLLLALPWNNIAWPLALILALITFMSRILSKRDQAIHDMVARTVAIDAKKSTWFANEEDAKAYVEENPNAAVSKEIRADEQEEARTSATIEAEEQILDLSTIDKRRAEARSMTSFDEFEKKSNEDFAAREEALKQREIEGEEPVDEETEKAAFRDLAAMEGLTEEEAAALAEEGFDEEQKDLTPPEDPDAFTDGSGGK